MSAIRGAATAIIAVGGVLAALVATGAVGGGTAGTPASTRTFTDLSASVASGAWGAALQVPGTATLNKGQNAQVNTVSCASAGNCVAGGFYKDAAQKQQAFVASEVNGNWRPAIEVPGTGALNKGGGAAVTTISCASASNCNAGGSYEDSVKRGQGFVVSEVNGTWHKALRVPGIAVTAQIGQVQVLSMSCPSARNCSAGGYFGYVQDNIYRHYGYVVNEVNGTWRKGSQAPGLAALSTDLDAEVTSLSCASAGNCAASGYYTRKPDALEAFVVSEVNGTWGRAIEVPGTNALNKDGNGWATSVSCPSKGNCGAAGHYIDGSGHWQAFVASQVNGTWRSAIEVPGTASLNAGGDAGINSVSCRSAGNCSAGGFYRDSAMHTQSFAVSEVNGSWGKAIEIPGTGGLNKGGDSRVVSLSCASAGNCGVGGSYIDANGNFQAYVASELGGSWHTAVEVPTTANLNKGGYAQVNSVSCRAVGRCAAGGVYSDSAHHWHPFVVSQR